MAAPVETTHPVAVETSPAPHEEHASPSVIDLSGQLAVWTWITFGVVCILLYKFAWKPILSALDSREADLRRSLEEAERIRTEMANLEETQGRLLRETEDKAKEILATARKGANEAARHIQDRAKEDAQILLENARRETHAMQEKARASLRRESADLAVDLAGRLLRENLDDARNKALTERLIDDISL